MHLLFTGTSTGSTAATMIWHMASIFESSLPQHCEPANDFLARFSSIFHVCVPTPLAFFSNLLGTLSIVSWLFGQLPQIYKNWRLQSTSGLSIFFLTEWLLGDLSNLLGALFTHQASWQVTVGSYYVFVDLCLVGQWIWYEKLRHGQLVLRMRKTSDKQPGDEGRDHEGMEQVTIGGSETTRPQTRPQIIFRTPTFDKKPEGRDEKHDSSLSTSPSSQGIYRVVPSSSIPSPSPRTVLLIACLAALAHASPLGRNTAAAAARHAAPAPPTPLENAGTVLSWMSTLLYLGSRLPQLFKNWRRKSTAGLSPHLFIAAFCGNFFYSSALLTNPKAWSDFGPYGGGGWAGRQGSDHEQWVLAALPFFLGAAGVLGMDASVGVQFLMYSESSDKVVAIDEESAGRWHWRKANGWMRGWFPSMSEERQPERQALIPGSRDGTSGDGYGGI